MNGLEIQMKFKERYADVTDEDSKEIYQTLKENNAIPKNIQELNKLFEKLEEIMKLSAIDDSEEFE